MILEAAMASGVSSLDDDPPVAVGAQNVHHELAGAYTGEVSAPMLVGLATWVIVGHSERRRDAPHRTGTCGCGRRLRGVSGCKRPRTAGQRSIVSKGVATFRLARRRPTAGGRSG